MTEQVAGLCVKIRVVQYDDDMCVHLYKRTRVIGPILFGQCSLLLMGELRFAVTSVIFC